MPRAYPCIPILKTPHVAIQKFAIKMNPSLRYKLYEERLAQLYLFSLDNRRLRDELIVCFKIVIKDPRMLTRIGCFKLMIHHEQGVRRYN